ncbi:MAG: phosphate ABC transporter substrate-binding protein [Xenococcaceae cyanobacterium]
MSQKNETLTLVLTLLITAGIIGGGYWWFTRKSGLDLGNLQPDKQNNTPQSPQTPQPSSPSNQSTPPPPSPVSPSPIFTPPSNVPSGTTVRIEGSTSMVQINQALKNRFEQQFSGTKVVTQAGGSNKGIQALLAGNVDIAAISRPLSAQESAQGLVAIPVAQDAVAIVVGVNNPFRRGLTKAQVVGIFQGQITDWSAVGGTLGTIRVINRPTISGTHQVFRELVLQGGYFGTTPNITTMQQDATTPILQALGTDGISYATFSQVANQRTVRIVAVDGLTPEAVNYPYQRTLYYAYKQPASPAVQAFLGYVTSPLGKQIISTAN